MDLAWLMKLPDPFGRGALHAVTENARVLATVAALRNDDLVRVGQLFNASHDSQRDDYAVSIAEIDLLVDLAPQDARGYGAPLTGGGFGGSIVQLTRAHSGRAVADRCVA